MNFEIGDRVYQIARKRGFGNIGTIVEIDDYTNRARVEWQTNRTAWGTYSTFGWNKFSRLGKLPEDE